MTALVLLLPARAAAAPDPMTPPGFSVTLRTFTTPLAITPLFAMPGEVIPVQLVPFREDDGGYVFHAEKGELRRIDMYRWEWTAPMEPGFAVLRLEDSTGRALRIHAFIKVPASRVRAGQLNGYRIGTYPKKSRDGFYAPPKGFIEVTEALASVPISPHFRIGQFLSKQASGWPKYLVLEERLVLKLEKILEELNLAGYGLETFHVLSGYRTPYYNKAIGNVPYSRHQYGDAADIFIDRDGDGWMDDLDGDGMATLDDARHIAAFIEKRTTAAWYAPFVGGLGIYGPRRHRGPFIHVDTRSRKARWEVP